MEQYIPINNTTNCFNVQDFNYIAKKQDEYITWLATVFSKDTLGFISLQTATQKTIPTAKLVNQMCENMGTLEQVLDQAINRPEGVDGFIDMVKQQNATLPAYTKPLRCNFDDQKPYFGIKDFNAINNNLHLLSLALRRLDTVTMYTGEISVGNEIQTLL